MKTQRIIYWIATIGICAIMLYSAQILKIAGVAMVLWRGIPWLTEWAYAGIFMDVALAAAAHYNADQDITLTLVTTVLVLASYFFGKEVRPMYR